MNIEKTHRSKPAEITAWQTSEGAIMPNWIPKELFRYDPVVGNKVYDKLHKTWILVNPGDWIILGTEGELYPCVDEAFQKKYEVI